jgi:hypothetical protein
MEQAKRDSANGLKRLNDAEFKLEPATINDIPSFVDVYIAAFTATDSFNHHLFPDRSDLPRWLSDNYRNSFNNQPLTHFFKVTQVGTGKIVGFSQWVYPSEDNEPNGAKTGTGHSSFPRGANIDFCKWFYRALAEQRAVIVGDRPIYCKSSSSALLFVLC